MTQARARGVGRPARSLPGVGVAAVLGGALLAACGTNSPTYFPGTGALEFDPGTATDDMPDVTQTLGLRFRNLTDAEEQARQQQSADLGYEVPRLREDRIHLEVRYTVTNLGDREGQFTLRLDGASEYARYDETVVAAAFTAAGEDPVFLGLIEPIPQIVGPGQSYQGVVREDDFHEASLDLDAMGRWMAPFASVLFNRSDVSPAGLDMVPPELIRPALWEVTLRFSASERMRCEFLLRVRDDKSQLWEDGEGEFMPDPAAIMPTVTMGSVTLPARGRQQAWAARMTSAGNTHPPAKLAPGG